jgi:hypothetical protein
MSIPSLTKCTEVALTFPKWKEYPMEAMYDAIQKLSTSAEANAVTCKQCVHYNIKEGHYSMECLSCKRYNADLFTPRADDSPHERR